MKPFPYPRRPAPSLGFWGDTQLDVSKAQLRHTTLPSTPCHQKVGKNRNEATGESTPLSPLEGPPRPIELPRALIFRVPVHQVWLPAEARPQDGAPKLLRCPHEAQTHPPGLQPTGVLPAHVSA